MKLALLERKHAHYDRETIERYRLLFEGGRAIRARMHEFIQRNDVEPEAVYRRRVRAATYINYAAPIVNALASWLFTGPFGVRANEVESDDLPEWAGALRDRATGTQDIAAFLGRRVADALVAGRSFWKVEAAEAPPGITVADWRRQGLDKLQLCDVPAARVPHWHRDDEGRFRWLLEREECVELESFDAEERRVIEWTLWSASAPPRRWRLVVDPTKPTTPETDVPEVSDPELPQRPGVPFVSLDLPVELWMLNLVADPLVEITRKRNALSWAIDRVCYAMAVLYSSARKPINAMGAGYYLQLGKDDKLEYPAPPSTPFDVIESHVSKLKDELYRVVQQMAAGVDNNAASVGRSGESKTADAQSTQIVLIKLGALVRDALEQTFNLAAELLGQPERFSAYGLDRFNLESVGSLVEIVAGVSLAGVESRTLRSELHKQLASRALPHAPASVIAKISSEIDATPTLDAETDESDDETKDSGETKPDVSAVDQPIDATKVADLAFNGAQTGTMLDVVKSAAKGEIPRESAIAILMLAFPSIDSTEAEQVLGSIGKGFAPADETTPKPGAARQPPPTTGGD